MTSRERWTVYPLLFLTLGISMRDKITSTVDVRAIRCESLEVTSGGTAADARVVVSAAPGRIQCESLTIAAANQRRPLIRMGNTGATDDSGNFGGLIEVNGIHKSGTLKIGHAMVDELGIFYVPESGQLLEVPFIPYTPRPVPQLTP